MRTEQIVVPAIRALSRWDRAQGPMRRLLAPMNPLDSRRYADPYPLYREAWAHGGPMAFQTRLRSWLVLGHDECEAVLRGPVSVDRSNLIDHVSPYRHLTESTRRLFTSMMLLTDPPGHARLRTLVNRAFTPRAVSAMEPRIAAITQDLVDELARDAGSGPVDAMARFADRVPIFAIAEMLGLPSGDRDRLKAISDAAAAFVDPLNGFDPAEMESAIRSFRLLIGDLLDSDGAGEGLVASLAATEAGGDRLSHEELLSMVLLLMVAGHETTSSLIGNALVHLDRHREQRHRLATEPDLAANAVEELLRYDAPVQGTDRIVLEDFDVGEHHLRAGALVVVLLGAANRDPRRHEDPDVLRLDREEPRPLSFGHGVHHCVGAALARLEAKVALPAFVAAFPEHRVVHEEITWNRSITLRGPAHLPVTLV